MIKRTSKPAAGASRVSIREATSAARVVYRDGTTGRFVILERDDSYRIRDHAKKASERTSVKGTFKERKDATSQPGSSRGDSKKR